MPTVKKQKTTEAKSVPATVPDDPAVEAWVHLAHAYHRFVRRLEQAFDEYSLTLAQFEVLARLHFDGAISQNELAQRLLVTKGNICGLLDRMTAANLVTRKVDPTDRRANRLHMTPEGRLRFARAFPGHIALIKEMMAPLPPAQLRILRDNLSFISSYDDPNPNCLNDHPSRH